MTARCLETVVMSAPMASVNSPTHRGERSSISMMRSRDGWARDLRMAALRASLFFFDPRSRSLQGYIIGVLANNSLTYLANTPIIIGADRHSVNEDERSFHERRSKARHRLFRQVLIAVGRPLHRARGGHRLLPARRALLPRAVRVRPRLHSRRNPHLAHDLPDDAQGRLREHQERGQETQGPHHHPRRELAHQALYDVTSSRPSSSRPSSRPSSPPISRPST